jgi:hypothetical protein
VELEELIDGMKERGPTEEDPREAPHEPLRPPTLEKRFWKGRASDHRCLGEREPPIAGAWERESHRPTYSASVVDRAIEFCFLEDQHTRDLSRNW